MAKTAVQLRAGVEAHRGGNLHRAARFYRRVLDREPQHPDALHLLGVVLAEAHEWQVAATCIAEAIRIAGPKSEYCANLGRVFMRQLRAREAAACFRQALRADPLNAAVTYQLGRALSATTDHRGAVAAFEQAIAIDPNFVDAHFERANSLFAAGLRDDAGQSYAKVIDLQPSAVEAHYNLGVLRAAQGRTSEAIDSYRRAIALRPEHAEAHNNVAILLHQQGETKEAGQHYETAFRLRPEDQMARYNLARLVEDGGRTSEALALYRDFVSKWPEHTQARMNIGNCLLALGEPDAAIVEFRRALEHDCGNVEAHWNLSLALLQTGCLQEGWAEYEWRFRQWPGLARDFAASLWNGGPLNGRRILLHAEQGIGDTLQFVRYADFAKRQGGWVVVECHPALVPLLRRMANVDEVVARDANLPPFDCHAPLMSLPRIAGTKLDTIPGDVPYMAADDVIVESWRTRVRGYGDGPCVGLAWAGNSRQRNDAKRSLGAGELAILDGLSGIQFFSLQKDERVPVEELRPAMIPLAREFRDFQDTAAAMAHLDLIVTVDTAVAHLAGALGRPVWTILPHAADWRWLQGREDSPWYPSMRLFRQVEAGEWGPVMRRVRNELLLLKAPI